MKKVRLVYGYGVNDLDRKVYKCAIVDGKQKQIWICPYYRDWRSMLQRCFCQKYQSMYPTYNGCTIYPDWKYLSKFIEWVDSQPNRDWENCQLDKDFLNIGNKHYSPETCVYITSKVNSFITDGAGRRGEFKIGVSYVPKLNRLHPYRAQCRDPFKVRPHSIGFFTTEMEAHLAWKARKHEYACQLADLQQDSRVAKALRNLYA